jgi:dipeptidyl aminopeptidase/acylaminoacyl peptidase
MRKILRLLRLFVAASAVLFVCRQGAALDARQPQAGAPQAAPAAASAFFPVPPNITAEGLPPIPASIPEVLAPYGQSRQALLLAWHPTKRAILIATTFGDTAQIHSVAGPGMDRRQLTFFKEPVNADAAYAPDGSYFLFRKDSGGGAETSQLFRYDVATGKSVMITDGKLRYAPPTWSHKSGLIAFQSNRRNGRDSDVYVMNPLDPSSMRVVLQGDGRWSVADWSPDDSELLVAQGIASGQQNLLWRVKVATGEKTLFTPMEPASWGSAQYSPDGRSVYAVSNRGGQTKRVWRGDVATAAWQSLTSEEEPVESCALSPDGRTLAVVFDSNTASRFELLDSKTLAVRAAPKLPAGQVLGVPQWHPSGAEVALTINSLRTWGDVYSVNARTGAVERWTSSELGPFNPESLPEPEIVKWKSFDGLMISGVLYRPPARFTGKRPVIMNIHGGPDGTTARERPRYQGRSAYFMNELGVAILYPNVRGSYGFGKAFEKLDDGLLREGAIKDIGALLDWIAQQPYLDKDRVMVTGPSYGGFMTYAVAEAYGDRIRCAYAAAGISNFISYFEDTDAGRRDNRKTEYGDPKDPAMREFLTRISPVTQVAKLKVPLMIAHGRKDERVPVGQAEEMYRAAKANGAPVWLVIYEDAGHLGFPGTVANYNFNFYTWILFAQTYLLNTPAATGTGR